MGFITGKLELLEKKEFTIRAIDLKKKKFYNSYNYFFFF